MFPTPPFDTSGSLIPLGEWGGGEAGRERPEQRRKEMPGIDPPGLARLQEIPVREKCCGLEHLFSFHGGMKPRLSGKGGGKEEERKRKMTLFFVVVVVREGQLLNGMGACITGWGVSPCPSASWMEAVFLQLGRAVAGRKPVGMRRDLLLIMCFGRGESGGDVQYWDL